MINEMIFFVLFLLRFELQFKKRKKEREEDRTSHSIFFCFLFCIHAGHFKKKGEEKEVIKAEEEEEEEGRHFSLLLLLVLWVLRVSLVVDRPLEHSDERQRTVALIVVHAVAHNLQSDFHQCEHKPEKKKEERTSL